MGRYGASKQMTSPAPEAGPMSGSVGQGAWPDRGGRDGPDFRAL
jgi:hypothetical protein